MACELAKGGGEVEVGRQLYGEAASLAPLSFVERGASSPEPTALLLLPALWGTAESMLPLIESVGRARRAIGVNFRGFGTSARKVGPHTPLERAYELHALVGQLGLQSVVILGHQESSEVALEAAALLPGKVRALIFWSADTSGGNLSACRELANAIEQGTKRLDALLTDEDQMVCSSRHASSFASQVSHTAVSFYVAAVDCCACSLRCEDGRHGAFSICLDSPA